jgi:hypothetical protein
MVQPGSRGFSDQRLYDSALVRHQQPIAVVPEPSGLSIGLQEPYPAKHSMKGKQQIAAWSTTF